MRNFIVLSLVLSATLMASCSREIPIRADLIVTGGTIYTDPDRSETVEAVAIGEGIVLYFGDMDDALTLSKNGTEILNLDEKFMTPGLPDASTKLTQEAPADFSVYSRQDDTETLISTIDDGERTAYEADL